MSDVAAAIRDSVLFANKWPIWKPARSRDGRDIDGHIPLPSGSDCARRRCRATAVPSCIIHSGGVSDVRLTMFPRVVAARPVDLQRISRSTRRRLFYRRIGRPWPTLREVVRREIRLALISGPGYYQDLHDVATPWNRREYASIIDFPIHEIYLCRPLDRGILSGYIILARNVRWFSTSRKTRFHEILWESNVN